MFRATGRLPHVSRELGTTESRLGCEVPSCCRTSVRTSTRPRRHRARGTSVSRQLRPHATYVPARVCVPSQMSYYLGSSNQRWMPTTWQHILDAAEAGILDETQWVELKAAIPPKSPAANLELARDLAALAGEGGLLIVGIKDSGGRADEVCGTELAGLGDRIDQVSRDRIHPPLVVRPVEITDPDRPGSGCVLVLVNASSEAPHMVDGRYWGRGATGKRPLLDSDVRKILDPQRRKLTERGRSTHELRRGQSTELNRLHLRPSNPAERPPRLIRYSMIAKFLGSGVAVGVQDLSRGQ